MTEPTLQINEWCYITTLISDVDAASMTFMEDVKYRMRDELLAQYPDADPQTFRLTTSRSPDSPETQLMLTATRRPQEDASGSPDSA